MHSQKPSRLGAALLLALAACTQASPIAPGIDSSSVPGADVSGTGSPILLPSYALKDLGLLAGGTVSQASAANSAGLIVGYATAAGSSARRAVYFSGGVAIRLPELPGATASEAVGVNELGGVVGYNTVGGFRRPVRWQALNGTTAVAGPGGTAGATVSFAAPVQLPTLGGPVGSARAVNDSGVVLGFAETAARDTIIVRWTRDNAIQRLDAVRGKNYAPTGISNLGYFAMNGGPDDPTTGQAQPGYRWDVVEGFLPIETIGTDDDSPDINGMNNAGVVVGGFTTSDSLQRAFRWTSARGMVRLGEPPSGDIGVAANAVNDGGIVAANSYTLDGTGAKVTSRTVITHMLNERSPFTVLPGLGGTRSSPVDGGIARCGLIAGWSFPPGATTRRAVVWVPAGGGCAVP